MPPDTHYRDQPTPDSAIIRRFLPYLWPEDQPRLKARIVFALLLVLISKGIQISMGFVYGAAIDRMEPGWNRASRSRSGW